MAKKAHTADERFILSLYESSLELAEETPISRYAAGKKAGLNPKGIDAICKLLVQANFIKKSGEEDVFLTPHGLKLATRLIEED